MIVWNRPGKQDNNRSHEDCAPRRRRRRHDRRDLHRGADTDRASASDPRPPLHERVVYATVLITTGTITATGWLLAQSGRPLVITNAHVAGQVGSRGATVFFYAGSERPAVEVHAARAWVSRSIDLGILRLEADAPSSARPLTLRASTTVVRGERIVLGGNPSTGQGGVLPFQTTEGVVTGPRSYGRSKCPGPPPRPQVTRAAADVARVSASP